MQPTRHTTLPLMLLAFLVWVTPTAAQADADGPESKTFVLVAGTWHGGWVWRDVRETLRARGHKVFTPTLTGTGDRVHLMSPEVGLDTHVTDVVNVIKFEELDDVILVGHSFAGLVITGVADKLRDKIHRVVFLDALVPSAQRPSGIVRDAETGELPAWWLKRTEGFVDGYQMVFADEYSLDMLVPAEDARSRAWLSRHLTNHPARTWTDPLQLSNGGWEGLPRTYIRMVGQAVDPTPDWMLKPVLSESGWQLLELDAPRDAMVTDPLRLADLLEELE
jgi:pimeloyl-ACP methyl ester carboxylesterase